MESTCLKLIMEKGPLQGETMEFKPGSTVRIGRLVRGNTIAIKDPGISSKHLEIQCISGKWFTTDLDSSNGTQLNSSEINPFTPFYLHDGDDIKIGERTSFRVEIVQLSGIQLRRNTRREAAKIDNLDVKPISKDLKKEIVEDVKECELVIESSVDLNSLGSVAECANRRGRSRGRPKKLKGSGEVIESVEKEEIREHINNVETNEGHVASTRRTRSMKKEDDSVSAQRPQDTAAAEMKQVQQVSSRRKRSTKSRVNVMPSSVLEKIPESSALDWDNYQVIENHVPIENKKTQKGRGRKKNALQQCVVSVQHDAFVENKRNSEESSPSEEVDARQIGNVMGKLCSGADICKSLECNLALEDNTGEEPNIAGGTLKDLLTDAIGREQTFEASDEAERGGQVAYGLAAGPYHINNSILAAIVSFYCYMWHLSASKPRLTCFTSSDIFIQNDA
ncbi:hypothetical protein Nepgr_031056 [Nepenthes gracilis]|uniref:FHA domain-containing protein n=1 Tax=Nepenthes gracilis TaxID=150966 RepID=A0AAD3THR7_NEPGR|nr:hypothetical protein Nepgr_031056 [Nepenthes gracilis]